MCRVGTTATCTNHLLESLAFVVRSLCVVAGRTRSVRDCRACGVGDLRLRGQPGGFGESATYTVLVDRLDRCAPVDRCARRLDSAGEPIRVPESADRSSWFA